MHDELIPSPHHVTPRREIRVLHVLACDDWGGTEVQVSETIIRGTGSDVHHALVVMAPAGVVCARVRRAGKPAESLHGSWGFLGQVFRLRREIREGRPDVIEAYGFKAGLLARVSATLTRRTERPAILIGVRGLHFTEGEDPSAPKTRLTVVVERLLMGTVRAYVANSQGARRFLIEHGFAKARIEVIPNGVEIRADASSSRAKNDEVSIVQVARFIPRKRQDITIRAFAQASRGLTARLVLIGDGPTLRQHERLAAALGVQADFQGRLSNDQVLKELREADIFVLSSLWEGMPGAVLEAMASGLPVVATDVNGTNEAVVDGETGLLVPPDDVGALADALQSLIKDPDRREALGANGLKRAGRLYGWSSLASARRGLYREIAMTHSDRL